MIVKELIERLKDFNPEAELVYHTDLNDRPLDGGISYVTGGRINGIPDSLVCIVTDKVWGDYPSGGSDGSKINSMLSLLSEETLNRIKLELKAACYDQRIKNINLKEASDQLKELKNTQELFQTQIVELTSKISKINDAI